MLALLNSGKHRRRTNETVTLASSRAHVDRPAVNGATTLTNVVVNPHGNLVVEAHLGHLNFAQ